MSYFQEENSFGFEHDIKYPIHIGPVFPCNYCKTNFINLYFLEKHNEKCKKLNIYLIEKVIFPIKPKDKKRTNKINKVCHICKKQFSSKYYLQIHLGIHRGDKPYKCTLCKKQYTHPGSLKNHILTHSGDKPHKCETCDKTFTHLTTLKNHRRIHTGDKPHKCETCKRAFTQMSHLKSHLRIHTGEKPHKRHVCNICNKKFSRLYHLTSHTRVHTDPKHKFHVPPTLPASLIELKCSIYNKKKNT